MKIMDEIGIRVFRQLIGRRVQPGKELTEVGFGIRRTKAFDPLIQFEQRVQNSLFELSHFDCNLLGLSEAVQETTKYPHGEKGNRG